MIQRADGEVGRVGNGIDTAGRHGEAFAGIPLDRVSVSLTINGMAAPITRCIRRRTRRFGRRERVVTTPQNDT